ncbi:hypothetical protein Tco_0853282 [Tanacetum coccineum]
MLYNDRLVKRISLGVLELDTYSLSKADPSESSPPLVCIAPMVSPFLCLDNLESDTEIPERHVSPTPHDAMLKIPTAPILPALSAIVAPSSEFPLAPVVAPPEILRRQVILIRPGEDIPIGRFYRTHPGGPCRALTVRKSVRRLPSHYLALRYTSHHLDHFTSRSSSSHSSSDHSSSRHSISGHSLSGHTPPDTTDADSSTPSRFLTPPPPVPVCWNLLPPRKRFRDSISPEDSVEEDIDTDVLEDIEANATAVKVAVDRDVEAEIDACIGYYDLVIEILFRGIEDYSDGTPKEATMIMEMVEMEMVEMEMVEMEMVEMEMVSFFCGNGNPNENNRDARPVVRECTYQDFMKCQSLNFKGMKGVVGLTSAIIGWKLHIRRNDGTDVAVTYLTMLCTRMVPEEEEGQVERYFRGLSDNIQGNVIAAEPTRLQDAVRIANNLMDQKLKGYTVKNAKNKRRQGYYRSDCPKLKDQNRRNKARNKMKQEWNWLKQEGKGICSDRSFMSTNFSTLLDVTPDTLDISYAVELADERIFETNTVLRGCTLRLLGHPFNIGLMPV